MKQNIRVSLTTASARQILCDGEADVKKDGFQYREKDSNILTAVKILADGVRVERFGEPQVLMHLTKEKSFVRVRSEEGEMEIPDVQLLSFSRETEGITLFYQLEELRCLRIEYKEK